MPNVKSYGRLAKIVKIAKRANRRWPDRVYMPIYGEVNMIATIDRITYDKVFNY